VEHEFMIQLWNTKVCPTSGYFGCNLFFSLEHHQCFSMESLEKFFTVKGVLDKVTLFHCCSLFLLQISYKLSSTTQD